MRNLGTVDRLLRVILAEICLLAAFFWTGRDWQIPLCLVAGVMLLQAVTGSCGFYSLLGWNSCEQVKRKDRNLLAAFVVIALALAILGGYASSELTKSILLEDLGSVKEQHHLVLQYSGQGDRQETIEHYGLLESGWSAFQQKYSEYRPVAVRFDANFTRDMESISAVIYRTRGDVPNGNLTTVHDRLQEVDPILQGMLDRNGLSL